MKLTRRDFLKVTGLGSAAAIVLAGCGESNENTAAADTAEENAAPVGTQESETSENAPADTVWAEHITFADAGQITAYSPIQSGVDNENHARPFNMVFNTLVSWNQDTLSLEPELAKEWAYNDAGDEITIVLRDDVTFHDGTKLTASDVEYSFTVDPSKSFCTYIDSIDVASDTELTLHLNQPNTELMNMLAMTAASIVSQTACEADAENGGAIGTGPWKFDIESSVPGDSVELVRNEEYWGEIPNTKYFTFKYVVSASSRLIALQNDESQIAYSIDFNEVSYAEEDENVEFMPYVATSLFYMAFNVSDGPAVDENLRLAIAYAINRDDIIAVVGDPYATPAYSLFNSNALGYFLDFDTDISYNPDKAKEYVAKCQNTNLTVMVNTTNTNFKSIIEVIQDECRQVGITIDIWEVDTAGLSANSKYATAQHEALIYSISLRAYPSDIARLLNPNLNSNKAIMNNEEITAQIAEAVATTDASVQEECYKKIQTIQHDNCYYIPLYYGSNSLAYRKGMLNIKADVMNRHDFSYVCIPE